MKTAITQQSFTTGQVEESVYARTDVAPLLSSLQQATNCQLTEQGPIEKSSGTIFVGEVKYSDKTTILKEFTFSLDQALILEVGDYYMRFWLDGGRVVKDYTAWLTTTTYSIGDLVTYSGGYYRCLVAHTSGVFATDLAADKWVATSGATDIAYEIATPWSHLVVKELSICGTADVLYIAHKLFSPYKLIRYANNNWVLEKIIFEDGPFDVLNTNYSITVSLSEVTAPGAIITASSAIFSADDTGRLFRIQKRATTLADGAIAVVRLSSFISTTQMNVTFASDLDAAFTSPQTDWRFGVFGGQQTTPVYETLSVLDGGAPTGDYVFSGTTYAPTLWARTDATVSSSIPNYGITGCGIVQISGYWYISLFINGTIVGHYYYVNNNGSQYPPTTGWLKYNPTAAIDPTIVYGPPVVINESGEWPAKVGLHQERLIFANTQSKPQTMWFSQTGLYENFAPTNDKNEVLDDSAFSYSLSGGKTIDRIEWLLSSGPLVVGTAGSEFIGRATNTTDPLTPSDVSFIRQSGRGSASNQDPVLVGGVIVYVQRMGKTIRAMQYDVTTDSFQSADLTRLNREILSQGVVASAYRIEPLPVLLYACSDGTVSQLLFEQQEQIVGWTKLDIGGAVTSIAVVPGTQQKYDTYFLVTRTINGRVVQYIERIAPEATDQNRWVYLNSALEYHNTSTISTAVNLEHLEGETVTIFADGENRGTAIVNSGSVQLGGNYSHVIIGLPYTSTIRLNYIEGNIEGVGSTFGKRKRLLNLILHTVRGTQIKSGPLTTSLQEMVIDEDDSRLFTINVAEGFKPRAGNQYIVHEKQEPFSIAAVTREVEFRA